MTEYKWNDVVRYVPATISEKDTISSDVLIFMYDCDGVEVYVTGYYDHMTKMWYLNGDFENGWNIIAWKYIEKYPQEDVADPVVAPKPEGAV